MWKLRNEALHGSHQKEVQERHLEQLQIQANHAYERATLLQRYNKEEIKSIFKMKVTQRKKQGVVALETWLRLATGILKTAES